MSFDSLGLSAALLRGVAEQGYTQPTPIQAEVIPVVLEGARRPRRRANRHRQDRRLHAAVAAAPVRRRRRKAAQRPRIDSHADARARGASCESVRRYGKYLPLRTAVDLRRCQHQPANRAAPPRRRYSDRDAGPSARSGEPGQRRSPRRRDLRARRSRPNARHGLPARHPARARAAAAEAPEPAFSATFPEDIRKLADKLLTSRRHRGRAAATRPPIASSSSCISPRRTRSARFCRG